MDIERDRDKNTARDIDSGGDSCKGRETKINYEKDGDSAGTVQGQGH